MEIDYLLTSTRSARRVLDLDAPIDFSEIRDCLRIGLHAANGSNQQSWRWLVITDPTIRQSISNLYRSAYLEKVGGHPIAHLITDRSPEARVLSSTEWLVDNMAHVPMLIIPCYRPFVPRTEGDASFHLATLYGSIFPAVWNLQLALHTRRYGTCITTLHLRYEKETAALLGIPTGYVQGCLLPVARLRAGHTFGPTPRRPLEEVVAVDGWTGRPL
ncbi:nitroreductase family protein [Mycobacterium sp. NPDC051804]|uniref:nitroreductase family protein n=1 Tax=Mycobacterium sp. NPDC051804 TaxID=3364295 RepID=UPI003790F8C5